MMLSSSFNGYAIVADTIIPVSVPFTPIEKVVTEERSRVFPE